MLSLQGKGSDASAVSPLRPVVVEPLLAGRRRRRSASRVAGWLGAAGGGWLAFLLAEDSRLQVAALAFAGLLAGNLFTARGRRWSALLPAVNFAARLSGPALTGAAFVVLLKIYGDIGRITYAEAGVVIAGTTVLTIFGERLGARVLGRCRKERVAVIGSPLAADTLNRELQLASDRRYELVGRVASAADRYTAGELPALGTVSELPAVVARHDIDLLLMSSDVPRLTVFDEFARSCLRLEVRLLELSTFYEDVLGHVPVTDINIAWFQHLMQAERRKRRVRGQRLLDIAVASTTAVAVAPLLVLAAVLIRRDGGPVLFRQTRVGEGGEPFTIYKFRTMRVGADDGWCCADDARVTPIGRTLRRLHVDELPQLYNVLRGEMGMVGPRPEQPGYVERLERLIPHYSRRHLIKPGLTGWAQVRCGYGGSEVGSAWKVAHDLYYLKHRSIGFDAVILAETLRTLLSDTQYAAEQRSVDFILAPAQGTPGGAAGFEPVQLSLLS